MYIYIEYICLYIYIYTHVYLYFETIKSLQTRSPSQVAIWAILEKNPMVFFRSLVWQDSATRFQLRGKIAALFFFMLFLGYGTLNFLVSMSFFWWNNKKSEHSHSQKTWMTGLKHFEGGCCYPAESYPAVYRHSSTRKKRKDFQPKKLGPQQHTHQWFLKKSLHAFEESAKWLTISSKSCITVLFHWNRLVDGCVEIPRKPLRLCWSLPFFGMYNTSIFYIYPSVDIWYDELSYKKINWWVCR